MSTKNKTIMKSPIIKSHNLYWLRQLIKSNKQLKQLFGDIIWQSILVIDANCILGDLIWLTKKRKNPEAKPEIQECIMAGTFVVYCTKSVVKEVNEKLNEIAIKRNIPFKLLMEEWERYKTLIKIKDPDNYLISKYNIGRDPDDAPTLALAEMMRADGIISKDKDIKAMGGKALSLEFYASARSYSRKAAITVSIKIAGYYTLAIGMESLSSLINLLKTMLNKILKMPDWIKLLLAIGGLFVLLVPKFRNFIVDMVKSFFSGLQEIMPVIIKFFNQIIEILEENKPLKPVITE